MKTKLERARLGSILRLLFFSLQNIQCSRQKCLATLCQALTFMVGLQRDRCWIDQWCYHMQSRAHLCTSWHCVEFPLVHLKIDCIEAVRKMAILETISGADDYIRKRIVEDKATHQWVSEELKLLHPWMSRGLSSRSIRRYCEAHDYHATSRLTVGYGSGDSYPQRKQACGMIFIFILCACNDCKSKLLLLFLCAYVQRVKGEVVGRQFWWSRNLSDS